MKIKKDTIGKIVSDIQKNDDTIMVPVEEVARNILGEPGQNELLTAVDRGCYLYQGDFYIEMILSRQNVIDPLQRTNSAKWSPVQVCPSPDFGQSVFRYDRKDARIEFLWAVPDEDVCYYLIEHAKEVVPAEQELLSYAIAKLNGTLLKKCKRLNKEREDSLLLVKDSITVGGGGPIIQS